MEQLITGVLLVALAVVLIRILLIPMKLAWKILLHSACGVVCLWLVNLTAGLTGISIPINAITAIIAGALGLPGIALLGLMQCVL